MLLTAMAALGLALAGCTGADSSNGGPASTTPAPPCPMGNWRSTQVAGNGNVGGVQFEIQGGSGVTVSISPAGAVRSDFSSMQPVTFTAQTGDTPISGQFTYAGTIEGNVDLPAAATPQTTSGTISDSATTPVTPTTGDPATTSTTEPATPTDTPTPTDSAIPTDSPTPTGSATPTESAGPVDSGSPTDSETPTDSATNTESAAPDSSGPPSVPGSDESGDWRPTGDVSRSDLRITITATQPVAATIVDNVAVDEVTNEQTTKAGNAVDLQPLLRAGTYQCEGTDTLVVTLTDVEPTVTWTLQQAS
jgi:hypothetical protein